MSQREREREREEWLSRYASDTEREKANFPLTKMNKMNAETE